MLTIVTEMLVLSAAVFVGVFVGVMLAFRVLLKPYKADPKLARLRSDLIRRSVQRLRRPPSSDLLGIPKAKQDVTAETPVPLGKQEETDADRGVSVVVGDPLNLSEVLGMGGEGGISFPHKSS